MLKTYFKIAGRSLYKNKIYTTINVLGLALGICACLAIYMITQFELTFDKFHPDRDRIYRIVGQHGGHDKGGRKLGFVTDPMAMTVRQELSGLETVSGFYVYYTKVAVPNGKTIDKKFERPKYDVPSEVVVADPQYFDIFKYRWLSGNPATSLGGPFQVVLSEKAAHKYFGPGTPDQFIGRQVIYNDSLLMNVSGIVEDWSGNTDFGFTNFLSFATVPQSFLKNDIDLKSWGMWNYGTQAFVKLAKGVSPAQVERLFPAFTKKHVITRSDDKTSINLQPLSDIHYDSGYDDPLGRKASLPTLYALMGIAAFILLIAAINFINLSTAQSVQRIKEIGIRQVLGSSRRQLILQFLTETFILTLAAVLLSALLMKPVLAAFHKFIPEGVNFQVSDFRTLIFLALLTLTTALLAGLYPALILSSHMPVISLKGEGRQSGSQKNYLRRSLIVFQFTIALLFIIGTGVIGDQIHFMLSQDMGFNKEAIVNIRTPGGKEAAAKKVLLLQKVGALPEIAMTSTSEETPAANGHRGTDIIYKDKNEVKVSAEMHIADEHLLPLYEMKLLAGRNLLKSDTMTEILLNESCARALGFKDPRDAIGRMVESGQKDKPGQGRLPVVGVVADFHSRSLRENVGPVFICSNSSASRLISLKFSAAARHAGDLRNSLSKIESYWKELYLENKFEYTFFDETIAAFYDKEEKTAQIVNTAMLICIFICCMGLFGLTTFMVGQRTREISIRKVLGASVSNIVQLLTSDFVWLIVISVLLASPIAWYFLHRWLQDFAYRIPIRPWVFIGSGLIALAIAMATVGFQTIRAALANPARNLRSE